MRPSHAPLAWHAFRTPSRLCTHCTSFCAHSQHRRQSGTNALLEQHQRFNSLSRASAHTQRGFSFGCGFWSENGSDANVSASESERASASVSLRVSASESERVCAVSANENATVSWRQRPGACAAASANANVDENLSERARGCANDLCGAIDAHGCDYGCSTVTDAAQRDGSGLVSG